MNVFFLSLSHKAHPLIVQYFSFEILKPTGLLPFANISFLSYLTKLNIPQVLKETSLLLGSMCTHCTEPKSLKISPG